MLSALNNINDWISLNLSEQDKLIALLTEELREEFTFLFTRSYSDNTSLRIATFKHNLSGVEMNLIPGGRFQFGFSEAEERQALNVLKEELQILDVANSLPFNPKTMRPVQEVEVNPFLIGRFPVLEIFAIDNVEINDDLFRPEFGDFGEDLPIYLTREELNQLRAKFDLDIPTEIQWEYAVRGGTKTLFYFGEKLPEEEIIENEVCLQNFSDEELNICAANNFGLIGLMNGEWCKDHFRENYQSPPIIKERNIELSPFAVRGGGAVLYPWENGLEWTLCISAIRYSSESLKDGTCGARFVKNLEMSR